MNPTAESQLKKHDLPVTEQNIRQYTVGYAMVLPSIMLTAWWHGPLKRLVSQSGTPYSSELIICVLPFILPGILCLLFSQKYPAFARGLRDVMVLLVTIIPIGLVGLGLRTLIIRAGTH